MELYSEEYFDKVRARYLNLIITKYEATKNQARDKEYAEKVFVMMNSFILAFNSDETTKMVTEGFDLWYRLGHPFEWIFDMLVTDLWKMRELAKEKSGYWLNPDIDTKYYKFLWLFNVRFFKTEEIKYDEEGKVYSHKKFTYNFTTKSLKKFKTAKTFFEQNNIFLNEIRKTEHLVTPKINQGWIKHEDPTKEKIFKILVKHKAQEEFANYVRKQGVFNTVEDKNQDAVENEEIESKIKKTPSPTLKHTRGRQVLALYFILEELGLENHLINKTDIARLLHLLSAEEIPTTDENIEKLDNSAIYLAVKRNSNIEFNKKFITDLEFIKTKLEPLATEKAKGIKAIVSKIKREIENLKE